MQRHTQPPRIDPESIEPGSSGDDDSGATVTRIGTVFGGAACAALAASLPAELRIGDGGSTGRALEQWLALSALLLPLAVVLVGALRRARVGVRMLVGEGGRALATLALWWCVLEAGVLSVVGTVLRAKTHHHGLAGVTFAAIALVTGVFSALVAARGAEMLATLPRLVQRVALYVAASAAFAVVALVGVRTARAEDLHTASALVDVLALVVASAIASARALARLRPLAIAGVPASAMLLVLGLASLRAHPALRDALDAAAPVQAWVLGVFAN
jgi:hypothetical protein